MKELRTLQLCLGSCFMIKHGVRHECTKETAAAFLKIIFPQLSMMLGMGVWRKLQLCLGSYLLREFLLVMKHSGKCIHILITVSKINTPQHNSVTTCASQKSLHPQKYHNFIIFVVFLPHSNLQDFQSVIGMISDGGNLAISLFEEKGISTFPWECSYFLNSH